MKIVDDKALVLRLQDPHRVTRAIKKSKLVRTIHEHSHEVAVYWNLNNSRRLTGLGVKRVPSPILRDYDWPGIYTPYQHQKITASFLTLNNRGFCFSEQGTGKTGAVIWAADYLMQIGDVKRALIICPLSIMHSAWMDDIFKLAMHRTAAVAHGTRDKRVKVINGDYDFVIINYDGVVSVAKELRKAEFDLVVADEATFLKNPSTDRWKACNSILRPETKLWALTGTPAAQSPVDAYGLAKIVVPHRVPPYITRWRDMVMTKVTRFKFVPKVDAVKKVNAVLQPAIRFTKKECLDLPEVTYMTREVALSKQQERYYKAMRTKMAIEVQDGTVTAAHAAAGLNKLLQISCGAVYSDDGDVLEFDAKPRLKVMQEVVENSSHKTIVFVPYKHAIDICAEFLRKAGYSTEIISGEVSSNNRTRIFKNFQESDDPQVLVIQPQSAAHGVTLTAANTICWFGPIASVETWLQANERINRPSQENKMTVVKICGSQVEKRVYAALESRESTHRTLTSLYESIVTGG